MKKIVLLLTFLFSLCGISAQTYKYQATAISIKSLQNNYWTDWSSWEECNILVVVSLDRNIINIYSQKRQDYDIYEYLGESRDGEGGNVLTLNCVNRDGLRCQVRLRRQSDGQKQLYVDFNDVIWVYCIEER